jgi:uncharacterized membrane protein
MQKIKYLWEELNSSFWFVPVLMLILSIVSAISFIYLDSQNQYITDGILRYLLPASIDSARSILTIIAGAMIGVAGTVFSITLVVVTLASSQLGPRLVRNFMYDKLNQVVLGSYVSSFVYCLIVLSSLKEDEGFKFIPAVSVIAALGSAIAGIILLVIFIHHVSISIQADKVISDISDAMSKNLKKLFPDNIGHEEEEKPTQDIDTLKKRYSFRQEISAIKSGYLQSVDGKGLMDVATGKNCIFILHHRPGDFLVQDMVICEVLSNEEFSGKNQKEVYNDFIIGKVRTPLQDAEFSINQMVEVACRALSPGINDPYTANACINNLTSIMCYLTQVKFPSPYRYDSEGKLRIIVDTPTFPGMLDASFSQIRQYADKSPSVLVRLLEAMIIIHSFARTDNQKQQIFQHAEMVMKAAERTFLENRDLEDMKEKFNMLIAKDH